MVSLSFRNGAYEFLPADGVRMIRHPAKLAECHAPAAARICKECHMPVINETIHAPDFGPGEWLNTPPQTLETLRGSVTLVDFWDYACLNCLRTLPYQQEWWRRYHDDRFTIVGVHAPQFAFSREHDNVARAVARLGIDYPVLLDPDLRTWRAWANRYWPSKYLVDEKGNLQFFQFGEGDYLGMEWNLQLLLRGLDPAAHFVPPMRPVRAEDEPGAVCYHATPLQYLGFARGSLGNADVVNPNQVVKFHDPGAHAMDTLYLQGSWRCDPEAMTLVDGTGTLALRYRGKGVTLVLQPPADEIGIVHLLQDRVPLPPDAAGSDARAEDHTMLLRVDEPRLYCPVDNPHLGVHELQLRVTTPGLAIYAVGFTTECVDGMWSEEQAA